jgi:hypothetical protein
MAVPTCSSPSLSRWHIDAPSGVTAGIEMRGISTVIPLKKADDLMAIYINEKQELKSVLQFEIYFPNVFSYNFTCRSLMLIFNYC